MPNRWKGMLRRAAAGLVAVTLPAAMAPLSGGAQTDGAEGTDGESRTKIVSAVSGPLTEYAGWDDEYMELVAQQDGIALYVNMITSDFYLLNQETGEKRFSSAAVEADTVANDQTKNTMRSLLSLTYYDSKNSQFTMNTYQDCLTYENQLSVEKIENGVRSRFVLGQQDTRLVIPQLLDEETFKDYMERCESSRDQSTLKSAYKLYTPEAVEAASNRDELLEKYPILAEETLYALRSITSNRMLGQIEEIFIELGLNADQVEEIDERWNVKQEENENPVFEVPMTITLEEGGELVMEIDAEELVVPDQYKLYQLNLLEYFGAAFQDETGYIFVPDGSGAVIDFRAVHSESTYVKQLYGSDRAILEKQKSFLGQNALLPVFGMAASQSALFTIIESGDALASVVANTPGRMSSYYTVYARYTLSPRMYMNYNDMMHDSGVYIFQQDISRQPIRQRYIWLEGKEVGYVDMAKAYRGYLEKNGVLRRLEEEREDIPFYMDIQGVIQTRKNILGISYDSTDPLTTFEQAGEIFLSAREQGISGIVMRYRSWANGGYDNRLNDRVKVEEALGGLDGLQKLNSLLAGQNTELYPETEFLYVASDKAFDGFRASRDAAHYLDRKVATDYTYDVAGQTRLIDPKYGRYVLSPKKLATLIPSFLKSYGSLGLSGLSAGSMGRDLNADYNRDDPIDRNRAMTMVAGGLATLRNSEMKVMVDGGNAYSLPYADVILDLPLTSSRTTSEDRMVPFYQIVVHGYVEYAGEPLNTAQNYRQTLLKSVETGAGLQFKWMYARDSILKDTKYAYTMYSLHYGTWLEEAADVYRRVNEVLGGTRNAVIEKHREIASNVFETVYSNGISVVVNYNDVPVELEAGTVGAMDFMRIGGQENG